MTGLDCAFCRGRNGSTFMVGLGDGRWCCGVCLKTLQPAATILTRAEIDDMIKLCHPDRHRGPLEKIATRATQVLLDLRRRIPK